MATVGQALTAPEAGWQRIDDSDPNITYLNGTAGLSSSFYKGGYHQGNMVVRFNVVGTTRLRLIGWIGAIQYTANGVIKVDGIQVGTFTQTFGEAYQILNADISGLTTNEHCIEISCTDGKYCLIDAIDIDETGELKSHSPIFAPANLSAIAGDAQVSLLWTAVTGATGYNVKRSTTPGGPYTTVGANVTGTSYVDTSVTNGTTYYYVVTAINAAGESGNSNEASATPVASSKALLRITMNDSSEREYQLSSTEIDDFVKWFNRTIGTCTTGYSFDDIIDLSKEYLSFEKIISFKVLPLTK